MRDSMSLAEFLALREGDPRAQPARPQVRDPIPAWRQEMRTPRPAPRQASPYAFPVGPGGITGEPPPAWQGPAAPRVNFADLTSADPVAFDTFPQWIAAQRQMQRRLPAAALSTRDAEPWRQQAPEKIGQRVTPLEQGAPAPQRGMEPPRAPNMRDGDDLDAAWSAALERTRGRMDAERRQTMRDLPRPGAPLIGQAFRRPQLAPPRR